MADVMYDPEQVKIEVLRQGSKENGPPEYALDDPAKQVQKCCRIVREICNKRGIDQAAVPCIHRLTGRFRYFDCRQGRTGGSHKCVILCSPEWRIAHLDEVKTQHQKWEASRVEVEKVQKEEAAKKLVAEAAVTSVINQANNVRVAEESRPSGATETKDARPKGR